MALVHLTGDASLLTPERRPFYVAPRRRHARAAIRQEIQADIRARAKAAIEAHLAGAPLPPPPVAADRPQDDGLHRRAPTSRAHYAPFLTDELGLGGVDTKAPRLVSAEAQGGGRAG